MLCAGTDTLLYMTFRIHDRDVIRPDFWFEFGIEGLGTSLIVDDTWMPMSTLLRTKHDMRATVKFSVPIIFYVSW